MRQGFYEDREYPGDDMTAVASHCTRFARRNDVNMFNMSDYRSCENCSHMTADNQCTLRLDSRFTRGTLS